MAPPAPAAPSRGGKGVRADFLLNFHAPARDTEAARRSGSFGAQHGGGPFGRGGGGRGGGRGGGSSGVASAQRAAGERRGARRHEAVVQERDDVGVVQRGDRAHLGAQRGQRVRRAGGLGGEELDGHRLTAPQPPPCSPRAGRSARQRSRPGRTRAAMVSLSSSARATASSTDSGPTLTCKTGRQYFEP